MKISTLLTNLPVKLNTLPEFPVALVVLLLGAPNAKTLFSVCVLDVVFDPAPNANTPALGAGAIDVELLPAPNANPPELAAGVAEVVVLLVPLPNANAEEFVVAVLLDVELPPAPKVNSDDVLPELVVTVDPDPKPVLPTCVVA